MMHFSISSFIHCTNAEILNSANLPIDIDLTEVAFDTRKIRHTEHVLFICLAKNSSDVTSHIKKAFEQGIRYFLVPNNTETSSIQACFLKVQNVLDSLQKFAAWHRDQSNATIIGITGSNGKTIIKEWLSQILDSNAVVTKSPASYNSQLGVPLSILELSQMSEYGVFEAGISQVGEMQKIAAVIQPEIGILSNIGDAHDSGFENRIQKLSEKLLLFQSSKKIIFEESGIVTKAFLGESLKSQLVNWSFSNKNTDYQVKIDINEGFTFIFIQGRYDFQAKFPLSDKASISNIIHVIICCLELGIDQSIILNQLHLLEPVSMRLVLKKVSRNCLLVDDSYNADLVSLENALDFANEQKKNRNLHLILTEFDQVQQSARYYEQLSAIILKYNVEKISYLGAGFPINIHKNVKINCFEDRNTLQQNLELNPPLNELILLKGARRFQLDLLIRNFESKSHRTTLTVSLDAIRNNIQFYKKSLAPSTKIMAVVKAGAYGSDSVPLAKHLLRSGISYLAVAYFDEAIELRNEGILTPIMIMNPDPSQAYLAEKYNLELEMYSLEQVKKFVEDGFSSLIIHVKIDSGMNRLGFKYEELDELIDILKSHNDIKIKSIFSHFSSAEDKKADVYTLLQYNYYRSCHSYLTEELGLTDTMLHICNSNAAMRFPEYQHDMIRLGIGLYGYVEHPEMQIVHILKSYISQIKQIKKGDTVGYNRNFIADSNMTIATISLGYADGISRKLGNGNIEFYIDGKPVKTLGNISMDTCSVDISELTGIKEGDEVIVFDTKAKFNKLAETSEKTSYELITGISNRVVRNYVIG